LQALIDFEENPLQALGHIKGMNRIQIQRSILILSIEAQYGTERFSQVLKEIKEKGMIWEETEKERLSDDRRMCRF
jgi:hypothetical protein